MDDNVKDIVEGLRSLGVKFTFDGPYMADFVERLDKVVEIKGAQPDGQRLSIWVGEAREAEAGAILSVVASATLLNNINAGIEETPQGLMIWFLWYSPLE